MGLICHRFSTRQLICQTSPVSDFPFHINKRLTLRICPCASAPVHNVERACQEHLQILTAMQQRNSAAAIDHHIDDFRRAIIRTL